MIVISARSCPRASTATARCWCLWVSTPTAIIIFRSPLLLVGAGDVEAARQSHVEQAARFYEVMAASVADDGRQIQRRAPSWGQPF